MVEFETLSIVTVVRAKRPIARSELLRGTCYLITLIPYASVLVLKLQSAHDQSRCRTII